MSETDDRPVLMLSPVDHAHTEDSTQIVADCGHKAWISAAGIQVQAQRNARTKCMNCVDPEVAQFEVPPEVYADLVQHLGSAEADRIVELAKIPEFRKWMMSRG